MKLKIGIIISLVVAVGLIVALVAVKKQAEDQHQADDSTIGVLSNKLDEVSMTNAE